MFAAAKPADRMERFRAWVEALSAALETTDLDALARLFAVECSWRPGPFAATLQGRPAIRAHLEARLPAMPGLAIRAEILGVGTTYGVAHWSLSWGSGDGAGRADGILLVALDPMGRGAAVREWTLEDVPPAP